jgi:hypothetical protein
MSRKVIEDFEENKGQMQSQHQKLLGGLKTELNRYEQAVSGSIFVEQFQTIVNKSLAEKDMLMLAQRLSQLEGENKHKQEIASIREEQIRMMSQLMLLTAGGSQGNAKVSESQRKQQEDIMRNVQKLIDKPILIQGAEGSVEMSYGKSSQAKKVSYRPAQGSEEESISEQIPNDHSESIAEDIQESKESRHLSSARKLLGSEQSVIQSSKELLQGKLKPSSNLFDRKSYQNFKTG